VTQATLVTRRSLGIAVGGGLYSAGMSSPHGFVIRPDDLLTFFGSATVARGQRYANLGRVRDVAWSGDGLDLTGRCSGSADHLYQVSVSFEHVGDGLAVEWASCSCPVGAFCKHAVALVLTAGSGQPEAPNPDRWRTVLGNVLNELTPPGDGANSPIGLEFSLAPPTRYRPGTAITVRPVTVGKRGTWIKTGLSWRHLTYQAGAGAFERRQYSAARAIAIELQRSMAVPVGEAMTISTVPAAFWALLDDAADAGVTVVADKTSGLQAVDFVKNAQLRLDFASDDAGGASMSVILIVEGERCDPGGVGLIGAPAPHGMYKIVDSVLRLGRFDPAPGRTTLELIGRDEQVHIPAETLAEFSVDILPRLIEVAPVEIEEGLFTPPTISGPMPVLTIKLSDAGARAYWSTRYDVNDDHHDFDPDSQLQRTGYRDAEAEVRAWQRVIPALQAVAAASRTWKHAAAQHVTRSVGRLLDAALLDELRAIGDASDAAGATSVASLSTLRAAVDLTLTEVAVLCGEILPRLDCRDAFAVEIDEGAPKFRAADNDPQLTFSSGGEPVRNDWFDLGMSVQVDGHQVPVSALIAELASGATHMLLPGGVYFRLDTPELLRLRDLLEEARALGEIEGDRINAGSYNVTLWEELLTLGVVDEQLAKWQGSLRRLSTARPPVSVEVPAGLDATLRDYQREGLNWLSFLWDNGLGGVLADDMGLGKTVQTLALIARVADAGPARFLVVAPTSVVTNWAAEARRFTPGLTAVAITSTEARSGRSLAEQVAGADIVITSYALLRIDFEAYTGIDWAGMILDEAQFVKNHNSKTHQCARRLDARFKLAITGTPMENNLMELWSLLSITAPGLFPSPKAFTDYFRKPIESGTGGDRLPVLRRRIKPVMLRRTKSQVAADLPAKQEQVLTLDLGAKHRKIYDTRMARERQKVLGLLGDWEKNRFEVFRSLTLLRQLSLHAGMVDETMMDIGSAKVDFLAEQLPELIAEGHSALVFSQFTGFLSILRSQLEAVGVSYSYLAGSSSSRERDTAVQSFRSGANPVFLISLKAGGFGLNLTEADYCFVCDPWWSPAAEAQAVDRTHRIGQTRPVTVYRLVSQGTIEEKVVALQERKRALIAAVVDEGEVFGSAITASDVRELFG
jgi:superfamily II DNA or RNA helicase